MPDVLRPFCIGLCVAVLAAMNLHGLSASQHELGHAADWPAVALTDTDDDHHAPHVHMAPEEVPDADADPDGDGPMPVGHHHHGGGDVQAAVSGSGRTLIAATPATSAVWRPGVDPALSSLPGDGPEHPPKRMRTVV